MNGIKLTKSLMQAALALITMVFAASLSLGADVTIDLKTEARTATMPDGAVISMWGFFDAADMNTDWTPGPTLRLVEGDNLTINLTNNLPEAVSIVIPGQPAVLAPVSFTDPQGRSRASSFTAETGPFTWNNLRAGTFLYHSGSHPAKQVQMGLYGALIVLPAAAGVAYTPSATNPATAFDTEVALLYSEIDPFLHSPDPGVPKPLDYVPAYYLINGQPYVGGQLPIAAGTINQNVLIRFLNAGLKTHVPTLLNGAYLGVIAEDGNLSPYAKQQYSVLLAAGKTIDAIWHPTTDGTYPLMDRTHSLTTAGVTGGGMLTFLQVGTVPGAPTAVGDAYTVVEEGTLTAAAGGTPPGVLDNDTGDAVNAVLVSGPSAGILTAGLSPDGSFIYTPNVNFTGTDIFTYQADSSNVANVMITVTPVNDAPVANDDIASTMQDTAVIIDVLANDTDVDGDMLMVMNVTDPRVTVNPDNTVTFTPDPGFAGDATFTYTANDGTIDSNVATVTVTVNAPVNTAPVAVDDSAATPRNTPVFINLIANDTDAEGNINPNGIAIVTQPTRGGTVTVLTNGVNFTPRTNFRGTDVFTYTISDTGSLISNTATVRVNVTR